jgi:hypothetical protein
MTSASAVLAGISLLIAQPATTWRDPSPHRPRFVTVDSSVRLEVLDWGGSGRPIVLLGCYLSAHVYDDIAQLGLQLKPGTGVVEMVVIEQRSATHA